MTDSKMIASRITRQLSRQQPAFTQSSLGLKSVLPQWRLAERLICSLALAGGMLLLGSVAPGLLAAFVAAAAVAALGLPDES